MPTATDTSRVLAAIDDRRLLELERNAIRIPSSTFQEGNVADFYANYLAEIGLGVEMMEVAHPHEPGIKSRQPIGRLVGTGGGPTLMLNGHMDPGCEMSGWSVDPYGAKFEDGWIWGMGAHDDKGGLAAAISAIEAIVRSGTRLRGDVLVTPVVAHKYGGAGTRALLEHGVKADLCINMEHTNNTVANVCVGIVLARFTCSAPELFFRYSEQARAAYMNPIEQLVAIIQHLGPSLTPIAQEGWMSFMPHPELPGFPALTYDIVHREHYFHKNYTGRSTREAEMAMQFRTVPGQTAASIAEDLRKVLAVIKRAHSGFNCVLEVPAKGTGEMWNLQAMVCPPDHPLVRALAEGQSIASGRTAYVGAHGRIGNVGDGNVIQEVLGIPTVQYGPGDIRIYKEWPTPDERVLLSDLVTAARAVAHATVKLCG